MIRLLIILPILAIASVLGVGIFLQPNDLRGCDGVITGAEPCARADAIVAVSGGDTNARTDEAIRLYQNGWAKYLIFSGAASDKSGPSNAAVMQQRAIAAGVDEDAIFIDEYSSTTRQNAENTANLLKRLEVDRVILVTSGYHQRRASMELEKRAEGVTVLNSPVADDDDWSLFWWLTPRGWSLAGSELIKIMLITIGVSA